MTHTRQMKWALSLVCFAGLIQTSLGQTPARFEQKEFVISFWVDPPADEQMDVHYRRIAEANFTVVLGGFGATTPEQMKRQLELCEKYGLKVILPGRQGPADQLPDGPACIGYILKDEPTAAEFPELAARVKEFRAARPGKLALINLFPSYAPLSALGTPSYDEHVRLFVEQTNTDVLCFDYYPMMTPDADGRQGYCENLEVVRRHSLQAGIPFWNFFNTMPFGPHSDPTEAQLCWQIYTSLAYGAKGVLYFCYWTPRGHEFPKGGAIITPEGRPTRHYEQAKRINARLQQLGPTLMKLTSTQVVRIKPKEDSRALLKGTPLRSLSDGDYLVGIFDHADGRQGVLLNNYHFAYTAWPTVKFAADPDKIVEIDPQTGEEVPLRDDSPDMPGLQLSLDAGEGRLFLVSE
ncbi:MAG TPA: hypothetical protein PL151_06495 [Phycisphaerae bacterium]|nr:hypothetical protein [Phycisphaerae bacterium]HOJ73756.1 hypothetical protein [Phycisphaerae bacterium]HPZ98969.1 hypothetical protein [Phycisphaerae bacterium]HQE27389.1 hypothetical protein [Phycisphaerae bacterium]